MSDVLMQLPVFVAGQLLEKVQSVKVELDTGLQEVVTTAQGLIGFSSGAKKVTLDITGVIPNSGPEFDYWNTAVDESWVDLQIGVGQGDFASTGKIKTVSLSGSTEKPAEVSFTWVGRPGRIE